MSRLTEIVMNVLATALSAAIIYLIRAGVDYLCSKVSSEMIRNALHEFQIVLEDGVGYIEQTFVRAAKESGAWNEATQKTALDRCIDYISNNLTDATLDILAEDKDDIEAWITAKVEAYIQQLKSR